MIRIDIAFSFWSGGHFSLLCLLFLIRSNVGDQLKHIQS